jgi:hypothetical protein
MSTHPTHFLRSFPRKRESRAVKTEKNWVPAFAGTNGVLSGAGK